MHMHTYIHKYTVQVAIGSVCVSHASCHEFLIGSRYSYAYTPRPAKQIDALSSYISFRSLLLHGNDGTTSKAQVFTELKESQW